MTTAPTAARSSSGPGAFGGLIAINALAARRLRARRRARASRRPSWPPRRSRRRRSPRAPTRSRREGRRGLRPVPRHALADLRRRGRARRRRPTQAVADDAGEVVTYQGQPVVTYFFSTSGGRTENVENTPLGTEPQPWLQVGRRPLRRRLAQAPLGPDQLRSTGAGRKLGGLVKGSFRGIQVVQRGVSPRIVAADVIGSRRPHARSPARRCARASACSTPGRSSPRSRPARRRRRRSRLPADGRHRPVRLRLQTRVRPVGALAGRCSRCSRACECRSSSPRQHMGEGRRGARTARRPLLARRYRAGRVPRPLPRREARLLIRAVIFDCDGVPRGLRGDLWTGLVAKPPDRGRHGDDAPSSASKAFVGGSWEIVNP